MVEEMFLVVGRTWYHNGFTKTINPQSITIAPFGPDDEDEAWDTYASFTESNLLYKDAFLLKVTADPADLDKDRFPSEVMKGIYSQYPEYAPVSLSLFDDDEPEPQGSEEEEADPTRVQPEMRSLIESMTMIRTNADQLVEQSDENDVDDQEFEDNSLEEYITDQRDIDEKEAVDVGIGAIFDSIMA